MNRSIIRSLIIMSVIGVAALAGALLCERVSDARLARPTLGYTDEEILALPYFDLLASAAENRGLPADVESYSIGDGYIHLLLPESVDERAVTVYIRDMEGELLARKVYDFTGKVMIGDWEVVTDRHVLPTLYFESADPAVYEAMVSSETKDIICEGNVHVCAEGKEINPALSFTSEASLQGRGASSWEVCKSKKSYSLRFKKSRNLLGLGSNKNWNLIGNAFDVSLIRNTVFNTVCRNMGISYQPGMQSVNLYVDGKYEGVYTLTNKIAVDKDQAPLGQGDYFYRKQPDDPVIPIPYRSKTWFNEGTDKPVAELIFPEEATSEDTVAAREAFQRFIDAVEDPGSDLESVCDLSNLARYYWIQEASMNIDAWERGVYMYYKGAEGKMYLGPVWDMDLTLGCPTPKLGVEFDSPYGWKIKEGGWYKPLFENEEFARAVIREYHEGGVREALFDGIEEFSRQRRALGADAYLNYLLYGHANEWVTVLERGDSYDEYCDNMIGFYKDRVEWIDEQMSME
ncbi:MAG: CotH kinase family protein [Lachnospiraceae bacterium]|nr:CotH kinase family protein [Lachnospiraceae bacterium]